MISGKKYILRLRASDQDIFRALKTGKKKIETRAATVRFQNTKIGDLLVFTCGGRKCEKKVKNVQIFHSVAALLKRYNFSSILPGAKSEKDVVKMYSSFPGYREKIKKFGLVAFELKK